MNGPKTDGGCSFFHVDNDWDTLCRGGPWSNSDLSSMEYIQNDFVTNPNLHSLTLRYVTACTFPIAKLSFYFFLFFTAAKIRSFMVIKTLDRMYFTNNQPNHCPDYHRRSMQWEPFRNKRDGTSKGIKLLCYSK